MKALVIIEKNRIKRFLVELHTDKLVEEVAILVAKKKYSKAAAIVLTKGRIEKEISEDAAKKVKADLIIEEEAQI